MQANRGCSGRAAASPTSPPAVRALPDAWDDAEQGVVQTGNREQVLTLLAAPPDTDRKTAEIMYATLLDPPHGLIVGAQVEPAAFEAVLRLRADQGCFEAQHDVAALARPGTGILLPGPA
jgi:hypothetical protein